MTRRVWVVRALDPGDEEDLFWCGPPLYWSGDERRALRFSSRRTADRTIAAERVCRGGCWKYARVVEYVPRDGSGG